jgi:hypothetical protein
MAEEQDLWETAFGRLEDDTGKSLKSFDGHVNESVVTLIEDIRKKRATRENESKGWSVTIPGIGGRSSKVINLRNMVYKIMEAAFEFNNIVGTVLEFDATKYGLYPEDVPCINKNRSSLL